MFRSVSGTCDPGLRYVWDRRWRDHLLRLADFRDQVGPVPWNSALTKVDDTDRVVVDLLMKGDLAP
ncbi:hypothetical protein [Lentzea jiangxiensis]|uniref:hypothetical protein n=1 Tax=Lentzea jiangxiensis TaxID=641025 RepID=UPI00115F9D15|nr:hypothetical protein [Lentzea jiangxiensis]